MEDKELLQQHPLFKKLSGQIVWYMFEERGTPQEDIDAFFIHLEVCKVEALDVMRRLLESVDDEEPAWLRVEVRPGTEDAPPCPRCLAVKGLLLPANHPRLLEYLPPYSVGCRARGHVLSARDAAEMGGEQSPELPPPPGHLLHCPTEWIFEHKWQEE